MADTSSNSILVNVDLEPTPISAEDSNKGNGTKNSNSSAASSPTKQKGAVTDAITQIHSIWVIRDRVIRATQLSNL